MTLSAIKLVLLGWLGAAVLMTVLWLVQRARRDAGVVDVGWAAGLGLLAVFYGLFAGGSVSYRLLVALLAGLWSARLATYVFLNRVRGKPEDGRYQTLRRAWGRRAQLRFFLFFQAQGLLDVVLSLPFLVIALRGGSLRWWAWVGVAVWALAVAGETIADVQLAHWRADPANRGRTCRRGLWNYSRHPNYFFEWLYWWVYVIVALGAHTWWFAFVGPALMTIFLFRVTGIPATERQALASRGDDYREYQRTTSMFVPWIKKTG